MTLLLQTKMDVKTALCSLLLSNLSCANNTPVAMANQICDLEAFCKARMWCAVREKKKKKNSWVGQKYPTSASRRNGCISCMQLHKSVGVHAKRVQAFSCTERI